MAGTPLVFEAQARRRPKTREVTKTIRQKTNRILATPAAVPPIPVKVSNAAINARIKNINDQRGIMAHLSIGLAIENAETLSGRR